MVLLSRVAERLYWGARYLERAEDTARVVRAFGNLFVDMPFGALPVESAWPPLAKLTGTRPDKVDGVEEPWPDDEYSVVRFLVTDRRRPGTVVAAVGHARENLRTVREVIPREAWFALNDLYLFVERESGRSLERRSRDRFLVKVIDDSRLVDGVIISTMTRDAGYELWRMGRYIERADMTTRVVGVRAAALMATSSGDALDYDEVHWMGVLRALSALQMYQRATRGPIEASSVVRFLLYGASFPRSVAGTLDEMERSLAHLSRSDSVRDALADTRRVLRSSSPMADDGEDLDGAMERLQISLAALNDAITSRYLRIGGGSDLGGDE